MFATDDTIAAIATAPGRGAIGVVRISGARYAPATGPATLCGVFVETNARGLATRVDPVRVGGRLKQSVPQI